MLATWSSKRCFRWTTYVDAWSSSTPRNEGLSKWWNHLRHKCRTQWSHRNGTRWWVTWIVSYACMPSVLRVGRTTGSRGWLMRKNRLHRCLKRRTVHKVRWRMKTLLEGCRKTRGKHGLSAVERLLHSEHWGYGEPRQWLTRLRIHYTAQKLYF
jgi:hypothetical protein